MPALNYQARFATDVEALIKRQTIRATRKRPIRAGDTLYHYTGMRTRSCRKLLESTCTGADDIEIHCGAITLNGTHRLSAAQMHALARADGFASLGDFLHFFTPRPADIFHGQLIKW